MSWTPERRTQRHHSILGPDQRSSFERDRDRILYSSAFRRLSGITQIVRAGESDVFHTRQQHTLKVAQVGRRIAQVCEATQPELASSLGVSADVVEAACFAHDLGHPPFGHVGEHVLNHLVEAAGDPDGFEGNAQSFRILTKLAVRFEECPGLDLTRATLSAMLKYPWLRDPRDPSRRDKWGAYASEQKDFLFAREGFAHAAKTAEADLMDWADDIAYSVHDLEDFHRCGVIPWRRILDGDHSERVVAGAVGRWHGGPTNAAGRMRDALRSLGGFLNNSFGILLDEVYEGRRDQRYMLRSMTSTLIRRYITAARLVEPDSQGHSVLIAEDKADEVRILKQITKDYIISNPSLAAQQKGQARIIENIFGDIITDTKDEPPGYLPTRLRYLHDPAGSTARFAADCIASLTEAETAGLHDRLRGSASGSVLDPIVR